MEPLPKLIAIVGPTASGKSALALRIAKEISLMKGISPAAEIVSADSRQIYRGMDIGTAKPDAAERAAVPHHMIDIRDPDEPYTVADYARDATAAIRDILARKRMPLLVGGTGLYVRAIIEPFAMPPAAEDPGIRDAIERELREEGLPALFAKLVAQDPDARATIDPHNPRRVVRALEVVRATGRPFTAQQRRLPPSFAVCEIGLRLPSARLRARIAERVDAMMAHGFVEEVKGLIDRYGSAAPALDAIGYREIADHLEGKLSRDEAVARIVRNTAHYAKRQMTWFKKDKEVQWIADEEEAISLVHRFLA
jgi:tRNA dimethylallyltransferase